MVAAQWGETRGSDARTGGGVSGRFRLLGAPTEAPDTTPPPFGTAPWGYRRSEVDAWASWVAGLVAHGRNETVRADSAEATLKATLERLEQLERPAGPAAPPSEPDIVRPLPTRPSGGGPGAAAPPDTATAPAADPAPVAPDDAGPGAEEESTGNPAARTSGLHFDPPADLPRRDTRGTSDAPASPPSDAEACEPGSAATPTQADAPPRDHDLARLHVVETTLHEVLGLLHQLADRDRRPAGS